MFSRSKPEPSKRRNHNLSQFGLIDISDDFDPTLGYDGGGDADDSDLEGELAAIAGTANKNPKKPKSKSKVMPPGELDKMIADSLKDVDSDDNDVDINDSELLGELEEIAGVTLENDTEASNNANIPPLEEQEHSENTPEMDAEAQTKADVIVPTTTVNTIELLKQRIEMYKQAETNAKAKGEAAKVRRFNRGLKTLNELLRHANAGKTINMEDIPPEVSVKSSNVTPASTNEETNQMPGQEDITGGVNKPIRKAPEPPTATESQNETITVSSEDPRITGMRARQQEYKAAALQSKRSGDTVMALQYLKVVKQFDVVIQMCIDGQQVDLSDMPPPPSEFKEFMEKMQAAANARQQNTDDVTATAQESEQKPQTECESEVQITAPATVLEALEQRLAKYKSVETSAKAEGNASKARRFGRIVKQYEDAIRAHKAGRTVAYDELPVPPGFGPLPLTSENSSPNKPPPTTPTPSPPKPTSVDLTEGDNASGDDQTISSPPSKKPSTPRQDLTTRTSGNQQKNNLAEQQMKILLERQKEFKIAAIEAKKAGEIDQAKEYLKIYKGFDGLLNAASSGLPVDLSTLPIPPNQRENLEASFAIVTTEDCDPNDDIADIRIRVEEQLSKQLMMCKNTRDHHKAMGDIAGMNRFENLALAVQKDLDLVRFSKRKNFPLPKFHYEKRSFNIVHCNTDLTDNEMEIVIVRGLNYNVPNPKDVDTYVKVECPLLNDETFKGKTNLIKDTDSPEYEQRFKVDIIRNNRQFNRIFKRHGIKFEVYSRGGFLRSDILIGTVLVKLQPLETKCDIHDTFNLMDGRRVVGGKLEIKIRLRNPILTKQLEHLEEKWLVLDA